MTSEELDLIIKEKFNDILTDNPKVREERITLLKLGFVEGYEKGAEDFLSTRPNFNKKVKNEQNN